MLVYGIERGISRDTGELAFNVFLVNERFIGTYKTDSDAYGAILDDVPEGEFFEVRS